MLRKIRSSGMEDCSNLIRVRVDLSAIRESSVKQAWVCVDRTILRTIEDFRLTLHHRFNLLEDRKSSLYLHRGLLPDAETVLILRDEDFIRITYDNLPFSFDTQSSSLIDFTPNNARSPTRQFVDGNSDSSVPGSKKIIRFPSVWARMPSFCGTYDGQTSLSSSRCLRNDSTEINSDINLNNSKHMKKKHKKHKHSKVEECNSSENALFQEERITGGSSESHENNMFDNEELVNLISPGEKAQKPVDETVGTQKIRKSKVHKAKKRKHCHEDVVPLKRKINGTSKTSENDEGFGGAETNKLDGSGLCKENFQNDGNEPASPYKIFKKSKLNEENLSTEEFTIQTKNVICDISDKHEIPVGVQEQCGKSKSDGASNLNNSPNSQDDESDHISSQTESKISEVVRSSLLEMCDTILCSSLNRSPLQVEGDCTQFLGNNCPKKKRRRRRKKGTHSVTGPSDNTCSYNFGDVLSSSECNTQKPISDFLHFDRNEQSNRKHIRFAHFPERSPEVGTLNSKCSDDNTGKEFAANIDVDQSPQEPFDGTVSPACEADLSVEKYATDTALDQEKNFVTSTQGDGSRHQNNGLVTDNRELQIDGPKSYHSFPALNKFPSVGDVIAYKVLELTSSYCPEVSDYKAGKIVNINTSTDTLEIDLQEEQVIVRAGKFENLYPDETPEQQIIKKVFVHWSALIEPKLISSSRVF